MPPKSSSATEYLCDCPGCMRGGRAAPKKVSKTTYNKHSAARNRISSFQEFSAQHGRVPVSGPLGSTSQVQIPQDISARPTFPTNSSSASPSLSSPPQKHLRRDSAGTESNSTRQILNSLDNRLHKDLEPPIDDGEPEDDMYADPRSDLLEQEHGDLSEQEHEDVGQPLFGEGSVVGSQQSAGHDAMHDVPSDSEIDNMDIPDPGSLADPAYDESPVTEPSTIPQSDNIGPTLSQVPTAPLQVDEEASSEIQATLEDLQIAQQFIEAIRAATLDNNKLPESVIEQMRNPRTESFNLDEQEELRTGIELYLDTETASEHVFNKARETFHRSMDRKGIEYENIPSLFQVKERIKEITGVYPIKEDMCPKTCIAYTGPFSDLENCPICHLPRYKPEKTVSGGQKKIPIRQFVTLPLGPQLQALWSTPEGARDIRYRSNLTKDLLNKAQMREDKKIILEAYEDVFHGSAYLNAVQDGRITDNDMVIMMSIDGAQLYQSKQSDCWIYIWVILDLAPEMRYKKRHVFPGGFIPGPDKPQNIESFLFPGFHHISALMKEGLRVWDAMENRVFLSYLFILLGLADGPGLTYLNGLAGHSGTFGCRLYCPVQGRRKDGATHYYPALLKPNNYSVDGCDHGDIDGSHLPIGNWKEYSKAVNIVLGSRTKAEHKNCRKLTGISRPSIFSAFPKTRCLPVPECFGGDLMHLISLNIPDLLISLWRGTMECDPNDNTNTWEWAVLVGDVWKDHGTQVTNSTSYLPGSFDRPPRNPAEKISSGYKAWEFLTYIFGLGPGLLHDVLPERYWKNFCKLVAGVRLLHQRKISKEELVHGHKLLVNFVSEFEQIYYQRKESRIHFCRQSIHALLHIGPEIPRLGPGSGYTQWPMERTIGNLGEEIRQPSQPFANLSERGARRAQVNALISLLPDLAPATATSHLSHDIGGGYMLSMADSCSRVISDIEKRVLRNFFQSHHIQIMENIRVRKWGRLQLPNLQFVRTAWKETSKPLEKVRMARNIMFYTATETQQNRPNFAEVQYFFQAKMGHNEETLALVSVYGQPDPYLLSQSSGALVVCQYHGIAALQIILVKKIASCIAMVPYKNATDRKFFLCEKMGLDVAFLAGAQEDNTMGV